jgi:hypothetical protein
MFIIGAQSAFAFYDTSVGRWLSRDPIEEKGGMNLYGMAANDPVNKYDLLGQIVGDAHVNVFQPLIDVSKLYKKTKYVMGWHFSATWKPPAIWTKWPQCSPCTKVLWLQQESEGYPYKPDFTPASYTKEPGVGGPWIAGDPKHTEANIIDLPSVNWDYYPNPTSITNIFKTQATCIEGRDTGKIYATILWGYKWSLFSTPVGLGPQIY